MRSSFCAVVGVEVYCSFAEECDTADGQVARVLRKARKEGAYDL
jgi:hypothetical protein